MDNPSRNQDAQAAVQEVDNQNFTEAQKARAGTSGAVMKRNFPHNYLDNAMSYRLLFGPGTLQRDYSLATTEIPPFVEEVATPLMFAMAAIYGVGRILLEGDPATATQEKGMVIGIGEILAPVLPPDLRLDVGKSRAKLVKVVRRLLLDRNGLACFGLRRETNILVDRAGQYGLDDAHKMEIGAEGWRKVGIEPAAAMRILEFLGNVICTDFPTIPAKMIAANTICIIKEGSVWTEALVQKVINALRAEMQIDIHISLKFISEIYRGYGKYMSSAIARQVITSWERWIPEGALVLRMIVPEGTKRLTAFLTVKRAVTECPTFYWGELAAIPIYGAEMKAYIRAAEIIGKDKYYGYNRNLGEAATRHYKNLATACAQLLHRAVGDKAAKCSSYHPAFSGTIISLIDRYIAGGGEDPAVSTQADAFRMVFNGQNRGEAELQHDPIPIPDGNKRQTEGLVGYVGGNVGNQENQVNVEYDDEQIDRFLSDMLLDDILLDIPLSDIVPKVRNNYKRRNHKFWKK